MSRSLSDVMPEQGAETWPGAVKKPMEEVIGLNLELKAWKYLEGERGKYALIRADIGGEDSLFSCGGKVVLNKLRHIENQDNLEPDALGMVTLKEGVRCQILKVKSKQGGPEYYDLTPQPQDKKPEEESVSD